MKIATYNVNGLRPRISQHGSLRKLLDSLDSDIICLQETKLSRQELRADVVSADGYESFFSCTRSIEKGRTGYSGVVTFCKVQSAFSSNEVTLPVDAEEGFTGVLENSRGFGSRKDDFLARADGLEEFDRDELLKIDSEGRCIITDHGHFVLFNIYGPRAACDDAERIEFKLSFYKILQKRWEALMRKGRRIIVVGDFNIAPSSIDRCDAGPDFENNEFRSWFRSLLVDNGGLFFDVFRAKHPERTEAYTCWSTNTGGEIFNFGSRIDHIITAGSCLHENIDPEGHNFFSCHVKDCDILTQFKRCKPGNMQTYRWKGGKNIKMEGSDHAPVFMSLTDIPDIHQHNTPSLSIRYCPQFLSMVSLPGNRMVPTARNSVTSAQLSAIVARLDAILAAMKDDIAAIKTQMIRYGSYCEESVSDLKISVENSMKETPTDEEQDGLKEELKAEVRIQEIGTVYNAATIILDESKIYSSKPTSSFTWNPTPKPISAYAKNASQSVTQNPTPQRRFPRTIVIENQTRFLKRRAADHRFRMGIFNLLETSEGQDEPLGTNKEVPSVRVHRRVLQFIRDCYGVCEDGQPTIEWMITWHNYQIFNLTTSRLSGSDVLLHTRY